MLKGFLIFLIILGEVLIEKIDKIVKIVFVWFGDFVWCVVVNLVYRKEFNFVYLLVGRVMFVLFMIVWV